MSGISEEIEQSIDNKKITTIDKLEKELKNIEVKYNDSFPNI